MDIDVPSHGGGAAQSSDLDLVAAFTDSEDPQYDGGSGDEADSLSGDSGPFAGGSEEGISKDLLNDLQEPESSDDEGAAVPVSY